MKLESKNNLLIQQQGRMAIASFKNTRELTFANSHTLKDTLLRIVTKKNTILEIDLSGVKFIDNTIVDTFNIISRMARQYNSHVFLSQVEPTLIEFLGLIRLYSVFDIQKVLPRKRPQKVSDTSFI